MEPIHVVALTLVIGFAMFAWGRIPMGFVALGMTGALLVLGAIDPATAGAGLGHPATLIIICMFIITAGVRRAGLIDAAVHWIMRASGDSVTRFRGLLLGVTAAASSIMNNTPVVALAIPVVTSAAKRLGQRPGRFLLPLSYASMLGGLITLIGTRANIVASEVLRAEGFAPFGVFEWTWLGASLTVVGLLYLVLVADRLVPHGPGAVEARAHRPYLLEVQVAAAGAGKTLRDIAGLTIADVPVVQVLRSDHSVPGDPFDVVLRAGDTLVMKGQREDLERLKTEPMLVMDAEAGPLAEVLVPPGSSLAGRSAGNKRFLRRHVGVLLAIRKGGVAQVLSSPGLRIAPGDLLLVSADPAGLADLHGRQELVIVSEGGAEPRLRSHAWWVLSVLAFVLTTAGLGVLSLPAAAVTGAVAVVASGTVKMRHVQDAVRWDVVLILAGTIPVGLAMQQTGLAALAGDVVLGALAGRPVWVALLGVYVATNVLTALISNTACVVLMAPIAIQVAVGAGLDPRAVMAAVMVASSADFNTPIGYETNTMVSGPGGYRFRDYLRLGMPLTLIVAVMTAFMLTPLAR